MEFIGRPICIIRVLLGSVMMVVKNSNSVLDMKMVSSIMTKPVTHHLGLTLINRKERVSPTPSG